MLRPKRLASLLTLAFLSLSGCYPGINNLVRPGTGDESRDIAYKGCVNTHVWQKGFEEGTTGRRDYGYDSNQMVWDCMANRGYAWVPTGGLNSLTKEGATEREKISDYTGCFQRDPNYSSYYNWKGQTQDQSIQNLVSCLQGNGYMWKSGR
jgi:hypothetical protein